MSEIKQEPRFELSPSPPSIVIDCRTTRDHPSTDQTFRPNSNSNSSSSSTTPAPVPVKPELTFSIERILGLNSYRSRSDPNTNNTHRARFPPQPFHHHPHHHHPHHHHQAVIMADRDGIDNDYTNMIRRVCSNHRTSNPAVTQHFDDDDYDDEDVDDDGDDDGDDEYIDVDVDDTSVSSNPMDSNGDVSFVPGYSKFDLSDAATKYQWLQCTRYHPPKIQRSKRTVAKKRKLGRNPRVPFTPHQVSVLEEKFRRTHYLSSMDVVELSTALNLTETRVKIWFQNRRARERRDKEASQRNQSTSVVNNNNNSNNNNNNSNKPTNFQPLTIPSVAWPITSPMTTGNYPRFDGALNFRPGYLSSAFRLYSPSAIAAAAGRAAGGGVGMDSSIETKPGPTSSSQNSNRLPPTIQECGSPRALVAFK